MNKEQRMEAAFDLRKFIDQVRSDGELEEIAGAHWNLEIGALTELFAEQVSTPALLFDEHPRLSQRFACVEQCVVLAAAPGAGAGGGAWSSAAFLLSWRLKRRLAEMKPLPPSEVKSAPVLQNMLAGSAVDIGKFPAPQWHEKDGGRYIGTFDAAIARDPDSGYVDVGTYRVQMHDQNTVGLWMIPGKHGNLIAQKYWSQGKTARF